jgi:hypothetical protein
MCNHRYVSKVIGHRKDTGRPVRQQRCAECNEPEDPKLQLPAMKGDEFASETTSEPSSPSV